MKIKKLIPRLLLLTVAALTVLSLLLGTVSYAKETENDSYEYDLSKDGSLNNKVYSSADILEDFLGEEISAEERAYLVSYGDLSIKYDDGITTAKVSAFLEEDGLRVLCDEYSYASKNGSFVTWLPTTATLGEERKVLSKDGEAYSVFFEGDFANSGVERVNVEYVLNVSVSKEDVLSLLNRAKNDIPLIEEEIRQKQQEYEDKAKEYATALEEYNNYVEEKAKYDSDIIEYKKYLSAYKLYKEKLDAYNEYLADLALYEQTLKKREQYEKDLIAYREKYPVYVNYLAEEKEYLAKLDEYNAYLESVGRFKSRLEIIDYAKVPSKKLGRTALGAINGDTVTSVLQERDSLESNLVGAPSGVIDLAEEATKQLRTLLNDYFSYTTDLGKYNYYREHYGEMKKAFVDLFIALDHLYSNSSVRSVLYETGNDEKYRILVAQLYLISMAISDEPVKSVSTDLVKGSKDEKKYKQFTYTSKFTMDVYKYTVTDILGAGCALADNNSAKPIDEPFPIEVKEPVAPTPVEKPIEPQYVEQPTEITPVSDPGEAPTEVPDPGEAPEERLHPAEPPKAYEPPKEYLDLIAMKDALLLRDLEIEGDHILQIKKTVSKKFIDPEEINVKFYSHNNGALLYETTVDVGTGANYEGIIPEKADDQMAYYVFSGWQTESGEIVDLSAVEADLALYPYFDVILKEYSVVFNVDGREYEQILPYGTIPEYPFDVPIKPDTEYYTYSFIGWDREISAITDNCEYTAIFDQKYIAPSNSGGASVYDDGERLVVDYGACFDRRFDISLLIDKAKDSGGVLLKTPFVTLDVSYSSVIELWELGAKSFEYEIVDGVGDSRLYMVSIYGENGEKLPKTSAIGVKVRCADFVKSERLKLFYTDNEGNRRYTKYSFEDGYLGFTAIPDVEYSFEYEYSVIPASGNLASISVESDVFTSGESVEISLEIPDNAKLTRLYYRDSEGKETNLYTSRFEMPSSDVILIAEVEYIRYKITFVNGDLVITSFYCIKGEMPTVPENPIKKNDSKNSYKFIGWSEEVAPATEDKVYYAVFEPGPLPPEPVTEGLTILQKLKILLAIVIGVLILLILLVVLLIKRRRKRKKNKV